jgi:NAD(P)-dependent dehydrogenase (short-subunit alcohol dehydrogenase family)
MIRVLARELAAEGITVNGIGPAVTETPMTRDQVEDTAWRDGALSLIPMGRFGTPEDLAGTVVLLMSPAGAFITGQTIYVDGGRTLV